MRFVQALHWLKDMLPHDQITTKRLSDILRDPKNGEAIREDLRSGLFTLPAWMQCVVRDLLKSAESTSDVQAK